MLETYSLNVTVPSETAVPFNTVSIQKGCTATKQSPTTIALNKCGVYMVSCDCTAATTATIQLYKDGVAQPQAQGVGATPGFVTLVQVDRNNSNYCCSSPVTLEVMNNGDAAVTYDNINLCVTKIC